MINNKFKSHANGLFTPARHITLITVFTSNIPKNNNGLGLLQKLYLS